MLGGDPPQKKLDCLHSLYYCLLNLFGVPHRIFVRLSVICMYNDLIEKLRDFNISNVLEEYYFLAL